MKIVFSWKKHWDDVEPFSEVQSLHQDSVDVISSILMDSGGLPYSDTEWFNVLIDKFARLADGTVKKEEWARECWSVKIQNGRVIVYSLYDEDCLLEISQEDFEKIILAWKDFITSKPQKDKVFVLEV